jgi:hypothetical protein
MQTLLLSCLCGAMGAVILWVGNSARATRDQLLQHDGKLFRTESL